MVNVRQREYAIGLRGTPASKLVTQNLWTCSGVIGIDDRSGVIFLCHMDTPWCNRALPALVHELRHHVSDLSGFRLHTVGGIRPLVLWLLGILGLGLALCEFWMGGAVALGVALFFGATRIVLWLQLRRMNVFPGMPTSIGYSSAWFGLGRAGVLVSAAPGGRARMYSYGLARKRALFKEPDCANFNMTKSPDSAYREDKNGG